MLFRLSPCWVIRGSVEQSYHTTIQASPIMTAVDTKKLQSSKTAAPAE
jgi:hypothetical protein